MRRGHLGIPSSTFCRMDKDREKTNGEKVKVTEAWGSCRCQESEDD